MTQADRRGQQSARRRWAGRVLDGLWLAALAVYIFAGLDAAPFHGDEATLLFMSRDYHYLVQQRDLERVLYTDAPADPSEQELRIINGTVPKMAMGLAWDLAGLTVRDVNDQWVWGFNDPAGEWDEWTWNHTFGHVPSDDLLRAGRASSAVLLALSVLVLFVLTRQVFPSRAAAWAATAIYVTTPDVLLNGRRAMLEGGMLLGSTLVLLAALLAIRAHTSAPPRRRALWLAMAALGAAGGFALANKHNNALAVGIAFFAVLIEPLIRRGTGGVRFDLAHVARLALAGGLAVAVFVALNPAWWSDPLHMPGRVLDARRTLLELQVSGFGGFESAGERVRALINHAFFSPPQYYEVPVWQEYIGDQIAAYEASGLAGRLGGPVWGWVLVVASAAGGLALARRWRDGRALLVLLWVGLTALGLLIATPLNWQRYYLPLQPAIAVLAGIGVGWLAAEALSMAREARLLRRRGSV